MTEKKSIRRVEENDDGTITVVSKGWMELDGTLSHEYDHLRIISHPVRRGRLISVQHFGDTDGWEFEARNTVYYDSEIVERELTDEEIAWCEDTMFHTANGLPETVWEVTFPNPDEFVEAVEEFDLDAFEALGAGIPDYDSCQRVVKKMQKRIEETSFRATKLNWMHGYPVDMPPEWDPDHSDKDKDHLEDMASMRADAHKCDWSDVFGLEYYMMKQGRFEYLDLHEPWVEPRHIVALDVIGKDDWSYCRFCAGVLPEEEFLHVQVKGYDEGHTRRVCEKCAEMRDSFKDDAVASALDKRAQRLGGQRRLSGDY